MCLKEGRGGEGGSLSRGGEGRGVRGAAVYEWRTE